MKHAYKDTRGLLLHRDCINDMLHKLDITENEMVEFLGSERVIIDGYAIAFLSMMESMEDFYVKRIDSDKPLNIVML